ncbi:hypothetical protein VCHA53O466_50362 [Vibrio chagasii]|nr:hypothetical protein VCHA53O466_50362 [Vibrio chagasii]
MQFKKITLKESLKALLFNEWIDRKNLKKVSQNFKSIARALKGIILSTGLILFTLGIRLLLVALCPLSLIFLRSVEYRRRISNLKNWNETFSREFKRDAAFSHPYLEIKRIIKENPESYGLIENDNGAT